MMPNLIIKNKIISKGKNIKNILMNLSLNFLNNGLFVIFFLFPEFDLVGAMQ